jgi:hypothetical protein
MAHKGHHRLVVLPPVAIEWRSGGQWRQGGVEVPPRIAGTAALTAKALPLSADRQGDPRTPTAGGLRPRVVLRGQGGLAQGIEHDVKSGAAGVGIDQSHGS